MRLMLTSISPTQPENILVKVTPSADPNEPPTLLLKLLDFGLATHYSASEPKLTTCCGSPAYHSPELWRSLREPSGTVKYWVRPLSLALIRHWVGTAPARFGPGGCLSLRAIFDWPSGRPSQIGLAHGLPPISHHRERKDNCGR